MKSRDTDLTPLSNICIQYLYLRACASVVGATVTGGSSSSGDFSLNFNPSNGAVLFFSLTGGFFSETGLSDPPQVGSRERMTASPRTSRTTLAYLFIYLFLDDAERMQEILTLEFGSESVGETISIEQVVVADTAALEVPTVFVGFVNSVDLVAPPCGTGIQGDLNIDGTVSILVRMLEMMPRYS